MAFKKKETNGDAGEKFKFEKVGTVLEGYLMRRDTLNLDDKDVPRYVVKTDKGVVSTLASYKLDEGLKDIAPGTRIRATFQAIKKLPGGKTLKVFDIEYDDEDTIEVA